MPRYARRKSNSKVYHVMLRGINRMPVFSNDDDRERFLNTIDRMKKEGRYEILAYCLMNTHSHLLMKEGEEPIERSLKRITVSYAYYYNKKYDRVGHVFQDRFRSEVVEDDNYLIAATRYIHNNPVKAGLVKSAIDYTWSSYNDYINSENASNRINSKVVLSIFSNNPRDAIKLFKEFSAQETTEELFIDIDNNVERPVKPTGNPAGVIEDLLVNQGISLAEIKMLEDKTKRNQIIREITENTGISVRELSRVLGLSKDIIFRA